MKCTDRTALYERVLDTLLTMGKDGGYVTFNVLERPGEYVQYKLQRDSVYGEVGSRQWAWPEQPLPAEAIAALAELGFVGGGRERNYANDAVTGSAADMAALTERLFQAAYALEGQYVPVVRELNLNDVPQPRPEPFTRAMVERLLRERGVKFFRDEDGDFRADFRCDGALSPVAVWFTASGGDQTLYSVAATAPGRPVPPTLADALARCNDWNRTHPLLKAMVAGDRDEWDVMIVSEIDFEHGVTEPQFRAFTDHAVGGVLAFWEWLATLPDGATKGIDGPEAEREQ